MSTELAELEAALKHLSEQWPSLATENLRSASLESLIDRAKTRSPIVSRALATASARLWFCPLDHDLFLEYYRRASRLVLEEFMHCLAQEAFWKEAWDAIGP
jgi:hypothetical protein